MPRNRQHDYDFWKKVARYGMTKVVITDHETGWRDGGESFTMRTRAAPEKGGDEGQADYARKIRALGFRYGIYNNYTDYSPRSTNTGTKTTSRGMPDNQWQSGLGPLLQPQAGAGRRAGGTSGPDHPAEVPTRHGLLRCAHGGAALGVL